MIADAAHPITPSPVGWPRNLILRAVRVVMDITHNSIALTGLAVAGVVLALSVHEPLRLTLEEKVLSLLLQRHEARNDGMPLFLEPLAAERATAGFPSELPKAQANVTYWLSKKYRVAPEPLSALVSEAFTLGQKVKLDPTLILAVMAAESSFNPFSQSSFGAQGLMQVHTRAHADKYEDFGGVLAAFDPVTNLRVGVQVLLNCIRKGGTLEAGLALYVGAVSVDASDYVTKVMAEHVRLKDVAQGKAVSVLPPKPAVVSVPASPQS